MLMTLVREPSARGWTLGRLSINGHFHCYTCEDVVRPAGEPKVRGSTAIPAGRYRVIVNRSPRFSKIAGRDVRLPLLLSVPGFEGIRIHTGNTAADTEGCILPGLSYREDRVVQSGEAFARLLLDIDAALDTGEQVWIEISQRQASVAVQPTPQPEPPQSAAETAPVQTSRRLPQVQDMGTG